MPRKILNERAGLDFRFRISYVRALYRYRHLVPSRFHQRILRGGRWSFSAGQRYGHCSRLDVRGLIYFHGRSHFLFRKRWHILPNGVDGRLRVACLIVGALSTKIWQVYCARLYRRPLLFPISSFNRSVLCNCNFLCLCLWSDARSGHCIFKIP